MGMFSTDNLLQENYSNIDIPYQSIEESYFLTALKYCKAMNEEFETSNKIFYKTILEANNDVIAINEGFSEFFDKVKEIVRKFIEFIKSLFARFNTALHSIIKSDKYITKHEKDFVKFSEYMEFDMDLYNFTIYDSTIPKPIAENVFKTTFDMLDKMLTDNRNAESITGMNDSDKVIKLKEKYRILTDDVEDFYDKFRQDIIGAPSPISSGDFSEELFSVFRDGSTTADNTTVDNSYVSNSLFRFKKYKDTLKSVKDTKNNIEKDYKAIEKAIDRMFSTYTSGNDTYISIVGYGDTSDAQYRVKATEEIKKELNMIAKSQANKVQQMSSITSMAFAAKLDAITDCYKQDKKVLYKALSLIQKYEGKEKY